MGIISAAKDFRNGLSVIFGKPKEGQGNRKLAKMCAMVDTQIPVYGKHAVRTQMIKSIESDLKRTAKKGGTEAVDKQLEEALATPEYVALCHKLGLEEPNLRVLAMDAKRKYV